MPQKEKLGGTCIIVPHLFVLITMILPWSHLLIFTSVAKPDVLSTDGWSFLGGFENSARMGGMLIGSWRVSKGRGRRYPAPKMMKRLEREHVILLPGTNGSQERWLRDNATGTHAKRSFNQSECRLYTNL